MKSRSYRFRFFALIGVLFATTMVAFAQGETCADPYIVTALPLTASGTTAGHIDDYDEMCSFLGSSVSPDVVYRYFPSTDERITIALCEGNTDYYTRLYVYEDGANPGSPYACNDFACDSPIHAGVSRIRCLPVYAGHSYCIIVDGRNNESGVYQLDVFASPCTFECQPADIIEAAEPVDSTNLTDDPDGGCDIYGWGGGSGLFGGIECEQTVCGVTFTFTRPSDTTALLLDLDWYRFDLSDSAVVTATISGAVPVTAQLYSMADCSNLEYLSEATIAGYDTTELTTSCLGPGTYAAVVMPATGPMHPSRYRLNLSCLLCGVPCEEVERASVYRAAGDSVRVGWRAMQTVGTYQVWATANSANDGNPDGGADPDWALAATVPGPAVAPFYLRATIPAAGLYANYVVVHNCTPIPPANDNCQGSLSLTDAPVPIVVNGNTGLAANDYSCQGLGNTPPACWTGYYDESTSCSGPDLVYDWVVPASGTYTIGLCGSEYDTGLLIYSFTCPSEPANPADYLCGNDDACGAQSAVNSLQLAENQHILVVVDGWAGGSGAFTLTISQP